MSGRPMKYKKRAMAVAEADSFNDRPKISQPDPQGDAGSRKEDRPQSSRLELHVEMARINEGETAGNTRKRAASSFSKNESESKAHCGEDEFGNAEKRADRTGEEKTGGTDENTNERGGLFEGPSQPANCRSSGPHNFQFDGSRAVFICTSCNEEMKYEARKLEKDACSMFIEEKLNSNEYFCRTLSARRKKGDLFWSKRETTFKILSKFPQVPYVEKIIGVFSNIDGCDVLTFIMIVHEYTHVTFSKKNNSVHLYFLDSVNFSQKKSIPVNKITFQAYCSYAASMGFESIHFYATPSVEDEDYVFHGHPSTQKYNNPQKLFKWYSDSANECEEVERVERKGLCIEESDTLEDIVERNIYENGFYPEKLEAFLKLKSTEKNNEAQNLKDLGRKFKHYADSLFVLRLKNPAETKEHQEVLFPSIFVTGEDFLENQRRYDLNFSSEELAKFATQTIVQILSSERNGRPIWAVKEKMIGNQVTSPAEDLRAGSSHLSAENEDRSQSSQLMLQSTDTSRNEVPSAPCGPVMPHAPTQADLQLFYDDEEMDFENEEMDSDNEKMDFNDEEMDGDDEEMDFNNEEMDGDDEGMEVDDEPLEDGVADGKPVSEVQILEINNEEEYKSAPSPSASIGVKGAVGLPDAAPFPDAAPEAPALIERRENGQKGDVREEELLVDKKKAQPLSTLLEKGMNDDNEAMDLDEGREEVGGVDVVVPEVVEVHDPDDMRAALEEPLPDGANANGVAQAAVIAQAQAPVAQVSAAIGLVNQNKKASTAARQYELRPRTKTSLSPLMSTPHFIQKVKSRKVKKVSTKNSAVVVTQIRRTRRPQLTQADILAELEKQQREARVKKEDQRVNRDKRARKRRKAQQLLELQREAKLKKEQDIADRDTRAATRAANKEAAQARSNV